VRTDGTVVQWGGYEIGTPQGNHPAPPAGLSHVTAVAGGRNHSVALLLDGSVAVWGAQGLVKSPAGLSGVTAIAAGNDHSLARRADGTVVSWMAVETAGPLGVADRGQANVPRGLTGVLTIAGGFHHSLAVVVLKIPSAGFDVTTKLAIGAGLMSIGMVAVSIGRGGADRRRRAKA
jgi:alpha-tubulin suppressor-like RCC1 family protein